MVSTLEQLASALQPQKLAIGPTQEETIVGLINGIMWAADKTGKGVDKVMGPVEQALLPLVAPKIGANGERVPLMTFQPAYDRINFAKQYHKDNAEATRSDADASAIKQFFQMSGSDLLNLVPSSDEEVAMEAIEELIPFIGALPPGGIRNELIEQMTKAIARKNPGILPKMDMNLARIKEGKPRTFESTDIGDRGEIPEVMFHVATERQGIDQDPMLYALGNEFKELKGAGGAGSPGVSFTDLPSALRLSTELKRVRKLQRTKNKAEMDKIMSQIVREDTKTYGKSAAEDGRRSYQAEFAEELKRISDGQPFGGHAEAPFERQVQIAHARAMHQYRVSRGGDPLIFGNDLANSQIEVLAVPKKNIPEGTGVAVHSDAVGPEFRVKGDVPSGGLEASRQLLRKSLKGRASLPNDDIMNKALSADPEYSKLMEEFLDDATPMEREFELLDLLHVKEKEIQAGLVETQEELMLKLKNIGWKGVPPSHALGEAMDKMVLAAQGTKAKEGIGDKISYDDLEKMLEDVPDELPILDSDDNFGSLLEKALNSADPPVDPYADSFPQSFLDEPTPQDYKVDDDPFTDPLKFLEDEV